MCEEVRRDEGVEESERRGKRGAWERRRSE